MNDQNRKPLKLYLGPRPSRRIDKGANAGLLTGSMPAPAITLAAPYGEGAILAIARIAAAQGQLCAFFTTLYWGGDLPPQIFRGSFARRRLAGVPNRLIFQKARPAELAFTIGKRLNRQAFAANLSYRTKERFDIATARALTKIDTRTVIAMYAAAMKTFHVARRQGTQTVLHFVNSHPSAHNALLREAGAPSNSAEYIPEQVARRVDAELQTADLILIPSRLVARQLILAGVSEAQLALIPYGVDPRLFAVSSGRRAKKGRVKCLYVGQISWRKGIRVLLDAARRLDGIATFTLIGPLVSPELLSRIPPQCDREYYSAALCPTSCLRERGCLRLAEFRRRIWPRDTRSSCIGHSRRR